MSGHSKWSTIKHKKAKLDAKRGQAFTKLLKEITLAARMGGGKPEDNPRLRLLMDKAREINMPLENTQRAIKKGTGELPGVHYEPYTYEGYGPYGIAVMIDTLSDNKNRTVAELRHAFAMKSGNLGETGSVSWMFERLGVVTCSANSVTEDDMIEQLLDYDVRDIQLEDGMFTINCDMKALDQIKKAVESKGLKIEDADFQWVAKTSVELPEEQSEKVYEFLESLQDLEDVQNVYANLA